MRFTYILTHIKQKEREKKNNNHNLKSFVIISIIKKKLFLVVIVVVIESNIYREGHLKRISQLLRNFSSLQIYNNIIQKQKIYKILQIYITKVD